MVNNCIHCLCPDSILLYYHVGCYSRRNWRWWCRGASKEVPS